MNVTKTQWKAGVFILAIVAVLFSFQNCGKAGFDSVNDGSNSDQAVDPKVAGAPFPYEISLNQISYMSCPTAGQKKGPFYSFRASSSGSTGGIRLTTNFVDYVDLKFGKGQTATATVIQSILQTAPISENANPIITLTHFDHIIETPSTDQEQISYLSGPFSTTAYARTLAETKSDWISYFPYAQDTQRGNIFGKPFLGSLYHSLGDDGNTFRLDIENQFYLAALFAESKDNNGSISGMLLKRPSETDVALAYGKGYRLQFEQPNGRFPGNVHNPILNISDECDMSVNPHNCNYANFVCLSYKIIRKSDRDFMRPGADCPIEQYAAIHREELAMIRRHLPADEWEVNTTLRCVVPIQQETDVGSCYLSDTFDSAKPATQIQYDYQNNACGGVNRECPQFVTFCSR